MKEEIEQLPPIGPSQTVGWGEESIDMYLKINEIIELINKLP